MPILNILLETAHFKPDLHPPFDLKIHPPKMILHPLGFQGGAFFI